MKGFIHEKHDTAQMKNENRQVSAYHAISTSRAPNPVNFQLIWTNMVLISKLEIVPSDKLHFGINLVSISTPEIVLSNRLPFGDFPLFPR